MRSPPVTAAVRVRRAEVSDLDDLVALEVSSFPADRLSRAQYRRHLDSATALVLVASANHRHFLGTAVVLFRRTSRVARLYSIATASHAQGKGVGSALVEAAESAARSRGCRSLRLDVRRDNDVAVRLYERLDYRSLGAEGTTAIRFEKPL